MDHLSTTIATATALFAGTNVDDLLVLTILFLASRANGQPQRRQIWIGQYAGVAVLVALSAVGALGLTLVPDRWVSWVGLVPLAFGLRGLLVAIRARNDDEPPITNIARSVPAIAGVTIANGADNISVYTPLFRSIGVGDSVLTIAVFAVGVAMWCVAGSWLGSHPRVVSVVQRFGHWIVPVVFILIGATIIFGGMRSVSGS